MASIPPAPRSVLITGASSGIGAALAQRYARPGAVLALCARSRERLERVAAEARAKGARVIASALDVADAAATEDFVRAAEREAALDLVIANAGVSAGTSGAAGARGLYGESPEQIRRIFAVNLDGVVNTVLPALALMQPRRRGHVALMSSLAGFHGMPGAAAYSASKAAVKAYGEALRGSLRADGIAVSVVCPGFVVSRMTARNRFPMPLIWSAEKAAAVIEARLRHAPALIAFPWPLYAAVWLLSALPPAIGAWVLRRNTYDTYGD